MKSVIKGISGILSVILIATLINIGCTKNALAGQNYGNPNYGGIFSTFGTHARSKGIQSGFSEGFGLRFENFGMKIAYIQNYEFDQDRIGIIPGSLGDLTGNPSTWNNLGAKRTAGTYGIDFDYYWNLNRVISLYAGPGLYYGQYQDIRVSKGDGVTPIGYVDAGGVKARYFPSVEAGVHVNVSMGSSYFLLGVGYHSERGITGDIGIRF